jgi:hypothetical protein
MCQYASPGTGRFLQKVLPFRVWEQGRKGVNCALIVALNRAQLPGKNFLQSSIRPVRYNMSQLMFRLQRPLCRVNPAPSPVTHLITLSARARPFSHIPTMNHPPPSESFLDSLATNKNLRPDTWYLIAVRSVQVKSAYAIDCFLFCLGTY